ncbi:MAG: hypothetical protein EXQ52_04645 [Bryobacterales bacterium]|nr:hypothetical protein [Bryobacterales bacterium]
MEIGASPRIQYAVKPLTDGAARKSEFRDGGSSSKTVTGLIASFNPLPWGKVPGRHLAKVAALPERA